MENLPPGWYKRRSGILLPRRRSRTRRAVSVGGVLLAIVMLAPSVAGGVSAMARAVVDVAQAAATIFSGDDECRQTPPSPAKRSNRR